MYLCIISRHIRVSFTPSNVLTGEHTTKLHHGETCILMRSNGKTLRCQQHKNCTRNSTKMSQKSNDLCEIPMNLLILMWHTVSRDLSEVDRSIDRRRNVLDVDSKAQWIRIVQLVNTAFMNWSRRQHAAAIDNGELRVSLTELQKSLIFFRDTVTSTDTTSFLPTLEIVFGAALAVHVALKDVRRIPPGLDEELIAPPVPLRLRHSNTTNGLVRTMSRHCNDYRMASDRISSVSKASLAVA
jgi:hypothetical protein